MFLNPNHRKTIVPLYSVVKRSKGSAPPFCGSDGHRYPIWLRLCFWITRLPGASVRVWEITVPSYCAKYASDGTGHCFVPGSCFVFLYNVHSNCDFPGRPNPSATDTQKTTPAMTPREMFDDEVRKRLARERGACSFKMMGPEGSRRTAKK